MVILALALWFLSGAALAIAALQVYWLVTEGAAKDIFLYGFIALFVGIVTGWGGVAAYEAGTAYPKVELALSDWQCTASHRDVDVTTIIGPNGQVTPMVTPDTVCDRYERKAR